MPFDNHMVIFSCGASISVNQQCLGMQMAKKDFFVKTVPLLDGGDDVAMVLSPQCFHNMNLHTDIFNHSNIHFWVRASSVGFRVLDLNPNL